MFDLYKFPVKDIPYTTESQNIFDPYNRVQALERAVGERIPHLGFVPYVQLHEFEALLFVDLKHFESEFPAREKGIKTLIKETEKLEPERINETPETAPSKRIIKHIPEYKGDKAAAGSTLAGLIGMEKLRAACPHFNDWIARLEEKLK